jgi:hypothetical protein
VWLLGLLKTIPTETFRIDELREGATTPLIETDTFLTSHEKASWGFAVENGRPNLQ